MQQITQDQGQILQVRYANLHHAILKKRQLEQIVVYVHLQSLLSI